MKLACMTSQALIERRAAGLSPAEGLRLEEHLSTCESCRGTASLLTGLRMLHVTSDVELPESARKRAINGALSSVRPAPAPPARRAQASIWLWGTVAACAVVGVLLLRPRQPPQPNATATVMVASDHVVSGSIEVAGREQRAGEQIAADTTLYAAQTAQLALGHASVELSAGTRVLWDPRQRRLRVEAGRVDVDVDVSKHRSFDVITDRFDVHVLGTRFQVDSETVHVVRGRVQVRAHGSQEVVVLEAQGRSDWQVQPAPTPAAAPQSEAPPSAAAVAPTKPAIATGAQPAIASLLAKARAELAERQVQSARRTLHGTRKLPGTSAERAEAKSLEAECHVMAGEFAQARAAFLRVADQFASLPAAETALFAAARLEAEHGQPERARALLERYLTHYPSGSFVTEARKRQKALATAPASTLR